MNIRRNLTKVLQISFYWPFLFLFRIFLNQKYSCNELEIIEKIHNNLLDVYDILQSFVIHMDKQGIKGNTIRIRFSSVKGYLSHLGAKISTDEIKSLNSSKKFFKSFFTL